ncbi:uncharacterized protein LOC127263509 [Andrographis paniculata]|uniref:uncharacterized protein LOC127263509 n=1 Tax=Andrographis paniculata TaxID=175694 RepID=UPI0021E967EC|nr:uncharacterized protein LOC127263509 [Andrographis paniculata]
MDNKLDAAAAAAAAAEKRACDCRLESRSERFSGATAVATTARFREGGRQHAVGIEWRRGEPAVRVCMDGRSVAEVRKVRWNFRGKETVFVDGVVVDVMWDVHDWVFGERSGEAVFLFRTREGGGVNGGESCRLWWMEEVEKKGLMNYCQEGFCLRICVRKNMG